MSDVMFLYNNDAIMPCGDWPSWLVLLWYCWWHVMPRLCRMHDSMWIISRADRGSVHWSSHQLVIDWEIASLPRVEPGSTRSVWRLTDADKNTYIYIYPLEAEIKKCSFIQGSLPCQYTVWRMETIHLNLDIKLLNLFVKRTTISWIILLSAPGSWARCPR